MRCVYGLNMALRLDEMLLTFITSVWTRTEDIWHDMFGNMLSVSMRSGT